MVALYQTDKEYKQHAQAISLIARQYHIKEQFIREIYEDILRELLLKAKFKNYLSVLVTRHVVERIYKFKLRASKKLKA